MVTKGLHTRHSSPVAHARRALFPSVAVPSASPAQRAQGISRVLEQVLSTSRTPVLALSYLLGISAGLGHPDTALAEARADRPSTTGALTPSIHTDMHSARHLSAQSGSTKGPKGMPSGYWVIDGVLLQSPLTAASADGYALAWRETLDVSRSAPQTLAVSLKLASLELSKNDRLVLKGSSGETQVLTWRDNWNKTNGVRWTPPIAGRVVSLELVIGSGSTGASVSIDAWRSWIPEQASADQDEKAASHSRTASNTGRLRGAQGISDDPESTNDQYGSYDLVRIASAPEEVYEERGPVARVDTGEGYCSGFLISDDLFMTNYHCVGYSSVCATTKIQFNYETDVNRQPTPVDEVSCSSLVQVDSTLDYAVLKLSSGRGSTYGWYTLVGRVPTGEQGTIIQHPNGRRKKAAIPPNCSLLDIADGYAPNTDFRHQCDTDSGTSGSPILDGEFNVVGLHHWGGASTSGGDTANQAVRMDRIVEDCTVCP